MKNSSQESVRTLFSLPKDEKIYDDFGCAYQKNIKRYGRVFISENFICFNSNVLGIKTKLIFPLRNITEIKRKDGIIDHSIDITVNEPNTKKQTYILNTFSSRNQAYKRMIMILKAYRQKNNLIQNSDSESEEEIEDDSKDKGTLKDMSVENETMSTADEVYFPPIDESKIFEVGKWVCKVSPLAFFDLFFKGGNETTMDKFYIDHGYYNLSVGNWKELEDSTSPAQVREMSYHCKIKDVPFCNEAKNVLVQKYIKEGDKLKIYNCINSLDVPYCSYFQIENTWEIIPYEGDKSLLRITLYINFLKSTMFKAKIEKKSKEEYKIEVEKWVEFVTKNNISIDPYIKKKPTGLNNSDDEILLHGVEKSLKGKESKFRNFIKNFYYMISELDASQKIYWAMCFCILMFFIILMLKLNNFEKALIENEKKLEYIYDLIVKNQKDSKI